MSTVLITGCSTGIGYATALAFARAGHKVAATMRNPKRAPQLADQAAKEKLPITVIAMDVDTDASVTQGVAAAVKALGPIDVLVNNAGIYHAVNAEETTDQIWQQTLAINLSAAFFLSRAAMPYLRQSKGVIVNIASDWGLVGGRNAVAYCASKGGLVLMSKAMALDHAAEGVRINAVCPGDVETPMLYRSGAVHGLDRPGALAEANASSRTRRVTTAAEVAALVAFLASDEAAQITGAAIPIDGGNTAGSAS